MKTDKLLKLIQQKKAMRSGGALPLPKHQSRGQVAPFITSDPKEFARRQQLYKDSLDLYNRQNLYNAQFLANFPNAPVIPNNRVDFGDLVNLVRQQNKTSVEKNATELVNILKEGIQPSKTHSRHYPSDGRYKAHIKRTEGPLLKPGHYVPNSVANRRGLLDSLGVFDDDTKSAKHSYDERIDDPFTNTWIRSGSVTQKWKNPLFGDEHTDQVFGVPYRVIHHAKIKPIGNLLYHQRIPFSTGSSTAAEIFDPSSAMYDDASALNVSLPYYKKPVQEVIYNPRSNAANSPIIVTDRNDPRIGYYTEAGNQIRYRPPAPMSLMPMRGMPSADVEAVPQKVVVPPTPALRPRFMDMRGEWSDVLPTAYPYAQTPEMLEKMGYRGSKKEGGLAKAQVGKPQPIVTLQRDQPITRMVKDPIIGFANDPNVVKYNQTLKDPVWSDPYQFLMNWYSDPVTKERLRKQGAPLNPMVEALNQKRFDDVFDWYLDQQEKNDKLAKSIYSKGDNFNDYVSFKEILNKISEHNYKRHADETNGFHIPSDSSVTITDNRRDKKLNNQTAVHELTHATPLDNFYRNYFENFKPTKADQKELDYFKENLEEIYPRIMDLRFQMNRDGILAPGIKVTPDMIEPYYNNSNDDIRNYYTPEELAKIMNEVAYNASAQESNLARHGGLTKFQSAGSVDFRLGPTVTKANALAQQNPFPVTLPNTAVQYIDFIDNRVMSQRFPTPPQRTITYPEGYWESKTDKTNSNIPLNFMGQPFATGAIEETISPLDLIGGVRGGANLIKGAVKYLKAAKKYKDLMQPNYIDFYGDLIDIGASPRAVKRTANQMSEASRQMHKGVRDIVLPNPFQRGGPTIDAAKQQAMQQAFAPYLNPAMVQATLKSANENVYNTLGQLVSTPQSREKARREKIIAKDPSKYNANPFRGTLDYKLGIVEPGLENDVLSDPIAMAAALTAGGVGLGATALSQVPRVFARNVASEATAGLSDIGKGLLKKLSKQKLRSTLSEPIFFSKFYESKRKFDEARQRYIDAINQKLQPKSLDDITKDLDKHIPIQDLSGRSKVPDQYMIDARGLAAKEPTIGPRDFYTPDEITANANQWKEYWDAREKYDEMNPQDPGNMIMSALTGNKSRIEAFENLFPDAKLPNWREKFYQPEHVKQLRESLPYEDQFRWQDPLAPKGGLKFFQQHISSGKEIPSSVSDYLSRLNHTWHLNDPRGYVSEMRGTANLSLDDIKNLSDEELKNIANTIHSKIVSDDEKRMMNDIFKSSSATPSLRGFRIGQMNKLGGTTNKLFPYGKTIEQYRDSVVKPTLDKYSINYQKGGDTKDMVVSDLWKQITGSDWSQAKKLGLTDGSYEQNMALRERLLKRQNIMNWYADGALMQFSTKKKALEAAKRFNDYFYPGITNIERLAVPRKFDPNTRKWNLEIPNFEFTMKKYGGSTRKIKIIKPK